VPGKIDCQVSDGISPPLNLLSVIVTIKTFLTDIVKLKRTSHSNFHASDLERCSAIPAPANWTSTVQAALKTTGGNKAKVAKLLSVGQTTLYRFLGANQDVF